MPTVNSHVHLKAVCLGICIIYANGYAKEYLIMNLFYSYSFCICIGFAQYKCIALQYSPDGLFIIS